MSAISFPSAWPAAFGFVFFVITRFGIAIRRASKWARSVWLRRSTLAIAAALDPLGSEPWNHA
jgi:hypothetical protein